MRKSKIYKVTVAGKPYFVSALTKQGACRDVLDSLRISIDCDLATGEEIFAAGRNNEVIISAGGANDSPEPEVDIFANVV